MSAPSIDSRLAVVESRIGDLDRELLRLRGRLHELESDRASLSLLMEQVKSNAARLGELAEGMETIATRAADAAVRKLFDRRDQLGRTRWSLRATWTGTGIAAGGFVMALIFGILK